ncbi:MAG: hydroxymethylbilane synthase [Candidatus Tumulicola sp.]
MLPIALRPDGRRALIVGGGGVAARKAESLVAAGFPIFVVASSIGAALRLLLAQRGGGSAERPYEPDDVDGAALVIAATDDDEVNARVVRDARAARVLVCDATDPERGDFSMAAAVRLGTVTLGIDSGGASPAFSKRIAAELAAAFGPEYGDAARTLAGMRAYVKTVLPSAERSAVLTALAALPVAELASMNPTVAEHEVEAAIDRLRGETEKRPTARLIAASRSSALAMTQTRTVAARLAERGIATTILPVTTTGDREQHRAIDQLGSVNVFVTELEIALRERRADYAVHSCKDLPSELGADMQIAAISVREDPRDAFCSERYPSFESLPAGAVVGTSSPRRRLQLAALRPDLAYEEIRGNVDTRLRKLREGHYDAIVLAMAGLNRLRARATHTVAFAIDAIVPAVAQGALAVETRRGDDRVASELRAAINDAAAELCVRCERAALRALRAGCSAPIGIHARLEGGVAIVDGAYAVEGGAILRKCLERRVASAGAAEALGTELAARLLPPPAGRLVVLPRTRERPSRIAEALRAGGVEVIELRAGDAGPDPAERTPDMVLFPSSGAVAAAQTYLARLRPLGRRPRVAAMGPHSEAAARSAGFEPDAVSEEAAIDAFVGLVRDELGKCP